MKDVSAVLGEFQYFRFAADLHGFTLGVPWHATSRIIGERLVHGGGIAGNGGVWHIEQRVSPTVPGCDLTIDSPTVQTRAGLRRIIREWLAGDRPCDRPGYMLHAKLNHRTGAYVWCYRRTPS